MKQSESMNLIIFLIILKNGACINLEKLLIDALTTIDKTLGKNQPAKYMNMTELIQFYGYPVREYTVETEDGYKLRVGRIPGHGPCVFLMHGLLNSADDYLTLGRGHALALLLADAGYDVWLGNARGIKYCKDHVTLSPEYFKFWNFTFHEIGYYDLPAMIDFALEKSNKSQLIYIGHSQGTTAFFVMASTKTEYNRKVGMMISLATVAWVGHLRSPLARALVPLRNEQFVISILLGLYSFFPSTALTRFIFRDFCSTTPLALLVCESFLFLFYGFNYAQVDVAKAAVGVAHFPSGASMKQLLHFLQLIVSKEFEQFDYGPAGNMAAYGSEKPQEYDITKITTPIAILYSLNDLLSDIRDVEIFIKNAPSVFDVYKVPYEGWNHMDYLLGKDAKKLVYKKVMALIKAHLGQ